MADKLFLNIRSNRRSNSSQREKDNKEEVVEKRRKRLYLKSASTVTDSENTGNKNVSRKLSSIRVMQGQGGNDQNLVIQPEIAILNQNYKTTVPLRTKARRTIIGSEEIARVHIADSSVSNRHLIIVDYEDNHYFINRTNEKSTTLINGIESYQFKTEKEDHTFFKLGNVWGAYYHPKSQKETTIKSHNYVTISSEKGTVASDGKPLIIGSSSLANIVIPGATEFLAIIYWNNKGVFIDNLTDEVHSGLKLNGEAVATTSKLNNNSIISYLNHEFTFSTKGTIEVRIKELIKKHNSNKQLSLSTIDLTDKISKEIPSISRPFTLGRLESNDITILNDFVSKFHCHLYRKNNFLTVKDNNSANHTYINGKIIFKEQLYPGDFLALGECRMLLHYST